MIINFNEFNQDEIRDINIVYKEAEKQLNLPNNLVVNLVMVAPETIQEMNNKFRNVNRITDVLSFPMLDSLNDLSFEFDAKLGEINIGDIYICKQRAIEQAKEYGHSLKRELCFLSLHGLLHLLGYDHMESEDEKIMFSIQDKILNSANITRD